MRDLVVSGEVEGSMHPLPYYQDAVIEENKLVEYDTAKWASITASTILDLFDKI